MVKVKRIDRTNSNTNTHNSVNICIPGSQLYYTVKVKKMDSTMDQLLKFSEARIVQPSLSAYQHTRMAAIHCEGKQDGFPWSAVQFSEAKAIQLSIPARSIPRNTEVAFSMVKFLRADLESLLEALGGIQLLFSRTLHCKALHAHSGTHSVPPLPLSPPPCDVNIWSWVHLFSTSHSVG